DGDDGLVAVLRGNVLERADYTAAQLLVGLAAWELHGSGRVQQGGLQLRRVLVELQPLDVAELDLPQVVEDQRREAVASGDCLGGDGGTLERARVHGGEAQVGQRGREAAGLAAVSGRGMPAEDEPHASAAAATSTAVSQSSVAAPRQSPVAPPSHRR